MHCKTEEEAKSFCRFLHKNGRRWWHGPSYLEYDFWDEYEDDTVYYFNEGVYGDAECAKGKEGYTVLEWSDFMEDEESDL